MHEKKEKNILRKTKSVCPICLRNLDAFVVERNGKIYLEKDCAEDGNFAVMISEFSQDYKELSSYYFYFIRDTLPQKEYYLCATTRCNIMCPICFLTYCKDKIDNLSLSQTQKISTPKKMKRFTFSHGEATLCENLPEMIKILRHSRKIVNMHTNGIKLADFHYAQSLKKAGINQISIQFDGFNQGLYADLRGSKLLEDKLKALDNLKKMSIPVSLNVTIAKGINEREIGKIFDYTLCQNFIKDISFITYSQYEPCKKISERYIMPDELLCYFEQHTEGKISRKDVVLFQKLFFAYMGVFKKRKCFNYYHYLIARTPNGYFPISDFIDLEKVNRILNSIKHQKKQLTFFNFIKIICSSLRIKSLLFIFHGITLFLNGGYPRKPTMFLAITFATICDPYKYDAGIANNCGQGIIINGNIHDSYGTYLMEQIRNTGKCHENRLCERFL